MSYYVEQQRWQHWPKVIVMRHKTNQSPDETRRYVPERTCRAINDKAYYKGIRGYCEGLKCSECGEPLFSDFNHCPWCGSKVVKR